MTLKRQENEKKDKEWKSNMKKKAHLMYQHTPFSACGRYLGNHSYMIQTFKISETSCQLCRNRLKEYKANTKAAVKKR